MGVGAEDYAAYSDMQTNIDNQATDGDMAITRLTLHSTHSGAS
jgi:hypothetical protein